MYAHGKLLLTGEYFVLDGALALAVPTRFGQRLQKETREDLSPLELNWSSYTNEGEKWFSGRWLMEDNIPVIKEHSDPSVAARLQELLLGIQTQNIKGLRALFGFHLSTQLEFPRQWGLGSSSTLVSLLAQMTNTNPYRLLADSFGGSGYDIACATADGPVFYQRKQEHVTVTPAGWNPPYREHIFFVYLGQKQNSREGIRYYRELGGTQATLVDDVSELTHAFQQAQTLVDAQEVAEAHEDFISQVLQMEKVQDQRFAGFPGIVKSLGAWGGDFVMVLSDWPEAQLKTYFEQKGCPVILRFEEMVLE